MRAIYLLVASVLVSVCLFVHAWGGVWHDSMRVDAGLRDSVHCDHGDSCYGDDLDDFYSFDDTSRREGAAATYALGAAALIMLVAATMVRNGPIERSFQVLFAAPCAIAMVLSILYAHRLTTARSMHVGWAPVVAVGGLAIALCAIFVQQPPSEDPTA